MLRSVLQYPIPLHCVSEKLVACPTSLLNEKFYFLLIEILTAAMGVESGPVFHKDLVVHPTSPQRGKASRYRTKTLVGRNPDGCMERRGQTWV